MIALRNGSEFDLGEGAALGPLAGKAWRVGPMGYSCREENVLKCLESFGSVLCDMGPALPRGEAKQAALELL